MFRRIGPTALPRPVAPGLAQWQGSRCAYLWKHAVIAMSEHVMQVLIDRVVRHPAWVRAIPATGLTPVPRQVRRTGLPGGTTS